MDLLLIESSTAIEGFDDFCGALRLDAYKFSELHILPNVMLRIPDLYYSYYGTFPQVLVVCPSIPCLSLTLK